MFVLLEKLCNKKNNKPCRVEQESIVGGKRGDCLLDCKIYIENMNVVEIFNITGKYAPPEKGSRCASRVKHRSLFWVGDIIFGRRGLMSHVNATKITIPREFSETCILNESTFFRVQYFTQI